MDMLSDNIEQMREFGISLGLDDKQIDLCIYKSLLQDEPGEQGGGVPSPRTEPACQGRPGRGPGRPGWCGRLCTCIKAVCVCCWLVVGVVLALSCHPTTQKALIQSVHPWAYTVVRLIRLTTLPLSSRYDLTAYHEANCLVSNPLYTPPALDCDPCREVKDMPSITDLDLDQFRQDYIDVVKPAVVLNNSNSSDPVTFANLQSMYKLHWNKFGSGGSRLKSTDTRVDSLDKLMTEFSEMTILSNVESHIEWFVSKIGPSQAFRTVFGRPSFIPTESEILLEKTVYIDSHKAKPYTLVSYSGYLWYVQAAGSRRLVLIPRANCAVLCRSFQVTLHANQAAFLPDMFWRVDSLPATGPDAKAEISIAYVGNFV